MRDKIFEDVYAYLKGKPYGLPVVICVILVVAAFAIWDSLPDSTKERLLAPETKPIEGMNTADSSREAERPEIPPVKNGRDIEVWSDIIVVPKGARNEKSANRKVVSLLLPPQAKNIRWDTYTKFADEVKSWEDCSCSIGRDCAWSRFTDPDMRPTPDGILVTAVLANWSHNTDRQGRIRATYDLYD